MFRTLTLAAAVLLPVAAFAQTAADLARLTGVDQRPVAAAAPYRAVIVPGGATAGSLALLAAPGDRAVAREAAPPAGLASAGAFAGGDLARLAPAAGKAAIPVMLAAQH
jgi:hypothetical protein